MKQIFLFGIAFFFGIALFAQHCLTSNHNMMRPGDRIIKQQVEYKDPGRSGENVLWDFGKLTSVNDEYTLKYSLGRDSSIVGTEHRTMYRHRLSNDSLFLWGYENSTTLMQNERPELLLKYPVSYGDSTFCYYNGEGRYCDRLKISAMGTITSKADAYGMMILPGGDTLKNVIRVRSVKTIAEKTCPPTGEFGKDSIRVSVSADSIEYRLANDSVLLQTETFRWYVKGYRYPIFETVKSITDHRSEDRLFFDVAFYYPPREHYYLSDDSENLSELFPDGNEDPLPGLNPGFGDTFSYNFYPNPVDDMLHIEYYIAGSCDVEIGLYDMHGIRLFDNRLSAQSPGIHTSSVDMSGYALGNYVLRLRCGESVKETVIIKK